MLIHSHFSSTKPNQTPLQITISNSVTKSYNFKRQKISKTLKNILWISIIKNTLFTFTFQINSQFSNLNLIKQLADYFSTSNPLISDPQNKTKMGIKFSRKPYKISPIHKIMSVLLCFSSVISDNTDLVYRGCADQKFPNPSQEYAQNLKTLLNSLLTQSTKTNFSKTSVGEGGTGAVFGLYQCRGDLNAVDCNNCVGQFPKLGRKYCGENAIASRIQLVGCTVRYEVVGFPQISSTELLYKVCKGGNVMTGGAFEAKRDSGFEEVETGLSNGSGFYAASSGSVYVMGQCEGDLGGSECGNCAKTALERLKVECGSSMSGQVYLNQCYVSYTYYPNGVTAEKTSSPGRKQGTAKTVAIVVGVTVAAGFLVAILLCVKSVLKKKPKKYQYGGMT